MALLALFQFPLRRQIDWVLHKSSDSSKQAIIAIGPSIASTISATFISVGAVSQKYPPLAPLPALIKSALLRSLQTLATVGTGKPVSTEIYDVENLLVYLLDSKPKITTA